MSIRNFDQKNSSQQLAKSAEMNTDTFWTMIRLAHERAGDDTDNRHRFIQEEVLKLSVPDALEFNRLFEKELSRSYSWKLADAAELIIGGINDGLPGEIRFLHFRIALMSIGREVYDTVLESPEFIANLEFPKIFWEQHHYWCSVVTSLMQLVDCYQTWEEFWPSRRHGKSWGNRIEARFPGLVGLYR